MEATNSNNGLGLFAGNRVLVANGTRPASPMLLPTGELPDLPLGEVKALEDEKIVEVTVLSTESGGLRMTSDNFTPGMEPKAGTGRRDDDSGHLTLMQAGELEVRGSGFAPDSFVDVWLFFTPKFIGTVTVGAGGTFSGRLSVPGSFAVGDHTLQANGVTATGKSRSLNLGDKYGVEAFEPSRHGEFVVTPHDRNVGHAPRRSSHPRSEASLRLMSYGIESSRDSVDRS